MAKEGSKDLRSLYLVALSLAIEDDGCLLNKDDRSSDTSQLSTRKVRDIIIAPNIQAPAI